MRRHLPKPLLPGLLHRRVDRQPGGARLLGRQTLGDGVGDDGGTPFLQEGEEAALLVDEVINAGRLTVEVGDDGVLFGEGRQRDRSCSYLLEIEPLARRAVLNTVDVILAKGADYKIMQKKV